MKLSIEIDGMGQLVDSLGSRFESNQVGEFDSDLTNHVK